MAAGMQVWDIIYHVEIGRMIAACKRKRLVEVYNIALDNIYW